MAKKKNYKTEQSRQRAQAHQFGQPNGNKRGDPSKAVQARWFYRWVEDTATEAELQELIADESKPAFQRNFAKAMLQCVRVQDFFDLTNQTHGYPKREISTDAPPEIVIEWDTD
jgi:chemotaxis regulatin CheY-phosphate phosphatase CheZ